MNGSPEPNRAGDPFPQSQLSGVLQMAGNKPLVLTVDATVDPLTRALRAGKMTLSDFGQDADKLLRDLDQKFQNGFRSSGAAMAASLQRLTSQQFSEMRRSADAAIAGGAKFDPLGATNAATLTQYAAASEEVIASLGQRKAAIMSVLASEEALDQRDESRILLLKSQLVATQSLVDGMSEQAQVMRQQATVFGAIEAEMGVVTDETANNVVRGHNRMGTSAQMLMHSVRAATDSFSAGLPITMILTEQVSRLGEAAAYAAAEAEAAGTAGAGFLAVIGEWAVPVVIATTVLGTLAAHMIDFTSEAEKNAKALDAVKAGDAGLSEAQDVLGKIFDLTTGKLSSQNEMLRLNARLLAEKMRAEGLAQQESANQTMHAADGWRGGLSWGSTIQGMLAQSLLPGSLGNVGDAMERGHQLHDVLGKVQSGRMSHEDALRWGGQFNFEGLKVDRQIFLQAMSDAVQSQMKIRNADLIDKSLDDGRLDPSLMKPEKKKRARKAAKDPTPANDSAYDQEWDRLEQQADQIRRKNVTDLSELARLDKEQVDDAHQHERDQILAQARQHAWSKADTDALLVKEDQLANDQKAAIDAKLHRDLTEKEIERQRQALSVQDQILGLQEQLAPTLKERVMLMKRILENERKADLLSVEQNLASGKITPQEADKQRSDVNQRYDLEGKVQDRQNADPIAKWLDQLRTSSADMNTALKSVEADGLKSLEDGLAGVITGTESLGSAFKRMADQIIADLARIAIQKMLVGIFGGGSGNGGSSSGGISIGSLVSGGTIDTAALGLADGGLVFGPGGPREDKVPAMLSAGEFVVNAAATKRNRHLLEALNSPSIPHLADGGFVGMDLSKADLSYPRMPTANELRPRASVAAPLTFDLRGAVMTEDLLKQMQQISAQHAAGVLVTAPEVTKRDIAEMQRQKIPT